MTKADFLRYEEMRDELLDKATSVITQKLNTTNFSIVDFVVEEAGVSVVVTEYSRGLATDTTRHTVDWSLLLT